MRNPTLPITRSKRYILFSLVLLGVLASLDAFAEDDGYVLFLSEYLYGDFYVGELGDIDRANPRRIRPRELRLPSDFRSEFEIGNADVSNDGKTIVFGARSTTDEDWGIYEGTINLSRRKIERVTPLIQNIGVREEDPRFSWDGSQIVYKCNGNICVYPEIYANPVVSSWCELWAPSFSASGFAVSFVKRCAESDSDRIWQFDLNSHVESSMPNLDNGPDRFAHFLDDGRIVYSHTDAQSLASSLRVYDSGIVSLLHDETTSDDDAYPDRHDREHIAFIGWDDDRYNLFVYRQSRRDSVQLTRGMPVLGPVLFR